MKTSTCLKIALAIIALISLCGCDGGGGNGGGGGGGGTCLFGTCGFLQGSAFDARNGQTIPDARVGIFGHGSSPLFISQQAKDQARQGFRQTIECLPEELTCGLADENGFYSLEVPADLPFDVQFTKDGVYVGDTFFTVTVAPDQIRELVDVSLVPIEFDGPGQISGTVVAAASGDPLADVRIVFRRGISLFDGPATAEDFTDSAGVFEADLQAGNYSIEAVKEGFETARLQAVVFGDELTTLEPLPLLETELASFQGELEGRVFDSLDGSGLAGAALNLRRGFNTTSGPVELVDFTNANGSYALAVQAGYYTVEVSLNNYNTAFFNAVVEGGRSNSNQNFTLLPVLPANSQQITIVLTWSGQPKTLQSSTSFDVVFDGQPIVGNIVGPAPLGSSDQPPFIEVFWNQRNGFQETTVITQLDPEGLYTYGVFDSAGSSTSVWAPLSNAKVLLYQGNNLDFTFAVPRNLAAGTGWLVFNIDQGKISVLNEFYQPPPILR